MAIFVFSVLFISIFLGINNYYCNCRTVQRPERFSDIKSKHKINIDIRSVNTGTLSSENSEVWYEFDVTPGIYEFKMTFVNRKVIYAGCIWNLYALVTEYMPQYDKNITHWSKIETKYISLDKTDIYSYRTYEYIFNSGKLASHIMIYDYSFVIDYNITIQKVLSFDSLSELETEASNTIPEGEKFIGYKLSAEDVYCFNISTINYEVEVEYEFAYISIPCSDVEWGESIDIYWNDTKIGAINCSGSFMDIIYNPNEGNYELEIKYTGDDDADGIYVQYVYLVYMKKDADHTAETIYYIGQRLDSTHNQTTKIIPINFYEYTNYLYIYPYTSIYTDNTISYSVSGNNSLEFYRYLSGDYYIILKKKYSDRSTKFNITVKTVHYKVLNPGETISYTFDKPQSVPILLNTSQNHYYSIDLKTMDNTPWSLQLITSEYTEVAYENTYYNESSNSTYLYRIGMNFKYFTGPMGSTRNVGYSYRWALLNYIDSEYDDVDRMYYYTPNKFLSILEAYNYTNDSIGVKVSMEDIGEIQFIGGGDTVDIELSPEDGRIHYVFMADTSIGYEYFVEISAADIDRIGRVFGEMTNLETYDNLQYESLFYVEMEFDSENNHICLEYFTGINGTSYIEVYTGGDFKGDLRISLEEKKPNTSPISWDAGYDDVVKIVNLSMKKDHIYELRVEKNATMILFVYAISSNGSTPIILEYMDSETDYFLFYIDEEVTQQTVKFVGNYDGAAYIIFVLYGFGHVEIEILDVTPGIPITSNLYIWLPIGIAIGVALGIIIIRFVKKEK